MRDIRIAIAGYGNVGKAFVKMLQRREAYLAEVYDAKIRIVAVSRSRGAVIDAAGIPLDQVDERATVLDEQWPALRMIDEVDYDVLIEITPINIMTGQPATDHIRHALARGKHVITANKGPIAWAYRELRDMAEQYGVGFCHESTVMDGAPVFNLNKQTLMGCQVTEVKGILNATTNFILAELEKGGTFEEAVAEGQRRGFVEADPSMDVDAWDATAKLTALMNVLMDETITPTDIDRVGIREITKQDINKAKAQGKVIKLLCHGRIENGKAVGSVKPTLVDNDDLLAKINGTAACVTITTDLLGPVSIIEHAYEPEIDQTAYGVLGDLFRILQDYYGT